MLMAKKLEVETFIAHFADQFYDPVKAHEYYLRNRKLKGRTQFSTKGFNEKQKQAWDYIKNQIKEKQKKDALTSKTQRDASIEQARQRAAALREQVAFQLIMLDGRLSTGSSGKAERQKIAADLKAVVAKYRDKYASDRKTAAATSKATLATEFGNVKKKIR